MAKQPKRNAPVMPPVSEEMKQWAAMLANELSDWPQVSSKPMFGMTAFYRGPQIFAVVPKTRAFGTANGIAFRFEEISKELAKELQNDARVQFNPIGHRWITFEVQNAKDVNAALEWLSRSFEAAKAPRARAKKVRGKKPTRSKKSGR